MTINVNRVCIETVNAKKRARAKQGKGYSSYVSYFDYHKRMAFPLQCHLMRTAYSIVSIYGKDLLLN